MKHFTHLLQAAAVLSLICGCRQEILPIDGTYTLEVTADQCTKTLLGPNESGKRKVFWENGDQICCNGEVSQPLTGVSGQAQAASFKFSKIPSTPMKVASPASIWKDETSITLPSEADSLIIPQVAASADGKTVALKAATAIVKLSVTGSGRICYVELSSNAQLCGDFLCDFSTGELTPTSSGNKVRLSVNADLPLELFIPVPAGEYALIARVVDDQGNYMNKTTTSKKTFTRGTVHSFESFQYVPTGSLPATTFKHTSAHWEITSTTASNALNTWKNSNKFYATRLDGASKAYVSTFAGSESSQPARVMNGSCIAAGNLNTGDGFLFTYPSVNLAPGTTVDFMCSLVTSSSAAPKYWLFEYYEDGQWKSVEKDLRTAKEDHSIKYTFYTKYFSDAQYTTVQQNFTLEKAVLGDLKMRCRVVGNYNCSGGTLTPTSSATVGFAKTTYRGCAIDIWENCPVKDSKKILCLGNSFTYCYGAAFLFNEIARSQGHEVNMNTFLKGGRYFREFLTLEMAQEEVKDGGYDYAILQDQSGQHARYFSDTTVNAKVLSETKALLEDIRGYSPSMQPIVENTWSFKGSNNYEGFGSYDAFANALIGGALLVTDKADTWMSPICEAFQKAYKAGITNLYHSDNKHPNDNGAYLKSCVNYLLIYGEPFDANVPDCLVDESTAAKLRSIAESVVLGNLDKYRSPDSSGVTPGGSEIVPGGGDMDPDSVVPGENGIATAQQLRSFAYMFNTGGDISSYCNADGEVVLLDNIDLDYVVWSPVGSSTGVAYPHNTTAIPSYPFKGVFNGNGFTIKGLRLDILDNQTNVKGLFGATYGAAIKNLNIDGVKLNFTSTGISSNHIVIGTITGYGYNTKISNVHITNLQFGGKATSTASRNVSIGGIAGQMISMGSGYESYIENCSVAGMFTNDVGEKYSNENTVNIGGIVGTTSNSSTGITLVKGCTNNASMDVRTHRAAGIVAMGFKVHIEDCVNNGNIRSAYSSSVPSSTSVSGVRHGGVLAYCSTTTTNSSHIRNCYNHGTMTTSESGSAIGGVIGLIRCFTVENCHNDGDVIGPNPTTSGPYRGLLVGAITSATNPTIFTNCSYKGRISSAMDLSDAVEATRENYLTLGVTISASASCPSWSADNVKLME